MNQFVARHQVAQLVGAAELYPAAIHLVEVIEVISLKHLIGELSQAHTGCALQPGLHAVATEHGAHPEVPSGLRQKPHHAPVLVPAQVVQHSHGTKLAGAVVEVQFVVGENSLDALTDAAGVRFHSVRRQPLPFAGFPAGITDLRRGPSEQSEDVVPGITEVQ